MAHASDTIYALSSGALPAGIAVVRISGSNAETILADLSGRSVEPRVARLLTLKDPIGETLDRALTLFFPEGASFTGEPVVELHLHGGKAVLRAVLDAIGAYPRTRPAEAGEFTRRAFINGRMDLTAAEGVADLISAETEAQRRFAIRNAGGQQDALYSNWRSRLIEARALIEADLDFADEADVPGSVADTVLDQVHALSSTIEEHLRHARSGEILRDGFRVVIVGEPNVGKSSLLNALARRDVAIVSDEAGTTRDLIEVALDLGGYKVVLTDTAGLRETDNKVERIGIERAREAVQQADLVLQLYVAGTSRPEQLDGERPSVFVATKADLLRNQAGADFLISVSSNQGIAELLSAIQVRVQAEAGGSSVLPSRDRHIHHLRETVDALRRAEVPDLALELCAEELRIAADHLGHITGVIGVDDLLDVVFSRFCIGK
ncbi:tRNA uridine-5-carboxymethylaminomethyl(34) synthesis GTPase MnmE [Tianweitania sp. BSSL-BM11]|uniref:tRNA modification GTPase MnmE n=1 Tax=Tianweitania aestuarii TaxID=2814886 RepID=A0ABS5RZI8_9HYPH|nr:tRNA uridine-5-carboxymethylaminomethyl(34) synthesis GTPase MnmE [Tianweitania aestuarii]MBS9721634.1 tRNA uridine-5-carboxymethylaminomethyl(34) synthesis GTPase MnmE [Tianweitania aestuarii]